MGSPFLDIRVLKTAESQVKSVVFGIIRVYMRFSVVSVLISFHSTSLIFGDTFLVIPPPPPPPIRAGNEEEQEVSE